MSNDEFGEHSNKLVEVLSEAARLHLMMGLPDTKKATSVALQWRYPSLGQWRAEQCYDAAMNLLNHMPTKR